MSIRSGIGKLFRAIFTLIKSVFIVLVSVVAVLFAIDFIDGPDIKESIPSWVKECETGMADSCAALAAVYTKNDVGVTTDADKATQYSIEACDLDAASDGCFFAGSIYMGLIGSKEDPVQARRYFDRGCDAGHARSCYLLGLMYEGGKGGNKNILQAKNLYEYACNHGDEDGCEATKNTRIVDSPNGLYQVSNKGITRFSVLDTQSHSGQYKVKSVVVINTKYQTAGEVLSKGVWHANLQQERYSGYVKIQNNSHCNFWRNPVWSYAYSNATGLFNGKEIDYFVNNITNVGNRHPKPFCVLRMVNSRTCTFGSCGQWEDPKSESSYIVETMADAMAIYESLPKYTLPVSNPSQGSSQLSERPPFRINPLPYGYDNWTGLSDAETDAWLQ